MAKEGTFWIDKEEGQLILKNGEEEENFFIEDELKLDDDRYLILVSADELDNEKEDAIVVKLIKEAEGDFITIIEDEDEFARVKKAYIAMDDEEI